MGVRRWAGRAGLCMIVAACAVLGMALPASATPDDLGGLDLARYCQSLGHHGTTATGPVILLRGSVTGPNYAYNNSTCAKHNGANVPISASGPAPSMLDACRVQYPGVATYAAPSHPDDAYAWKCFPLPPVAGHTVADKDNAAVTALLQTDTVQAEITDLQQLVDQHKIGQAVAKERRFLSALPTQELISNVLGGYQIPNQRPVVTELLGVEMTKAALHHP
jgi:hypothetical protein